MALWKSMKRSETTIRSRLLFAFPPVTTMEGGDRVAKGKYEQWLEPEGLLRLEGWARDGLTDEQIAHNIGIHRDTLIQWKKKYPDIADTLKKAKDVVDREVENALFKKACGYTVELRKPMKVKRVIYNEETGRKLEEYEEVVDTVEEVHVPADTTAQIFWLKNRKPEAWRDKVIYTDESDLEKLDAIVAEVQAMRQEVES